VRSGNPEGKRCSWWDPRTRTELETGWVFKFQNHWREIGCEILQPRRAEEVLVLRIEAIPPAVSLLSAGGLLIC
jgi:hypothetical protein